jgi:hypothetical protein
MKGQIVNDQDLAIMYKVRYNDLLGGRSLQWKEMMASFARGHKSASHFARYFFGPRDQLGSL